MFDSLKKKLSGWFKKKPEEETITEAEKKTKKRDKEEKKVAERKIKKAKKPDIESRLKKESENVKEEVPLKFDAGKQKYEPDLEAIEDKLEETSKEELREEFDEEKKGFFSKLKKKLSTSVLKQEEFDEIFEELEFILLENNVALEVVDKIKTELGKDLVGVSIKKGEVEDVIKDGLKKAIGSVLIAGEDLIKEMKNSLEPYVILFFGINGGGKTTSLAKLAFLLKKGGISCVVAAADTFRAASIEQLESHAKKIGVPIIKGEYGSDPASIGYEAIKYAKSHKIKVVLIDTAGRMYTKTNLMKEMEKIVRVCKPNLKLFVGESITGNDATKQAKMFNETAGIDGIILTKADVDEKAGAILSVSYVTGKPIYFLGTGQNYGDLKEFRKEDVLKNLGLDD